MNNKNIFIIGIGHNSAVTIELAELVGYKITGLIHYNDELTGTNKWGYPVIASTEKFLTTDVKNKYFALSMGNNLIRRNLYHDLKNRGATVPSLIHPTASVSRFATIAEGVQIHANATVQPDVSIDENSIISYGVGLSHNVIVQKHCYIACQSLIGAYTRIEDNVLVGMGSTTISSKVPVVGRNSVIGAGSLIVKSVPENSTVYGRPAR